MLPKSARSAERKARRRNFTYIRGNFRRKRGNRGHESIQSHDRPNPRLERLKERIKRTKSTIDEIELCIRSGERKLVAARARLARLQEEWAKLVK